MCLSRTAASDSPLCFHHPGGRQPRGHPPTSEELVAPPGTAEEERDTCPFSRPWGPDEWMGDKVTAARLRAEVKVFGDCRLPFKYEAPHRFYCPTHPSCILERGKDFTRFDSFLSWCVLHRGYQILIPHLLFLPTH